MLAAYHTLKKVLPQFEMLAKEMVDRFTVRTPFLTA